MPIQTNPLRRYPLSAEERTKLNADALSDSPYDIVRKAPANYEYPDMAQPVDGHIITYTKEAWPSIQKLVPAWQHLQWQSSRMISMSASGLRVAGNSCVVKEGMLLLIVGEYIATLEARYASYPILDPEAHAAKRGVGRHAS